MKSRKVAGFPNHEFRETDSSVLDDLRDNPFVVAQCILELACIAQAAERYNWLRSWAGREAEFPISGPEPETPEEFDEMIDRGMKECPL